MTKYESQVYTINTPQAQAYARMADLRSFEAIKTVLADPANLQRIAAQIPSDKLSPEKLAEASEQIARMTFTEDSLSAPTKMGDITLAIVEREAPKLVKLEAQGAPVGANVWVQLLPQGTSQTALKVTVGAKLNFFVRKMVEKHLKQAPDGIATFLTHVLAL